MCRTMVRFLLTEKDIGYILPTSSHVEWVMEIIGHSFSLSMKDSDVISGRLCVIMIPYSRRH